MILRKATFSDLAALLTLEAACFEPYRRDSPRLIAATLRAPKREVWVVDVAGQPVVAALMLRFPHKHLRIYSIAVDPQWQGYGLGQKLLERAFASANERNLTQLRLEVEAARTDLIGWYEKNGFRQIKVLLDFYGLNRPALQMQKNLQ